MSLVEVKQIFGTLIFGSAVLTIVTLLILCKIVEVSYNKAHKKQNKVQPRATKRYELVLSKEQEKNITLPELKEIRYILGGI